MLVESHGVERGARVCTNQTRPCVHKSDFDSVLVRHILSTPTETMLALRIALSLSAACRTVCFVPATLRSNRHPNPSTLLFERSPPNADVFEGVHLPENEVPPSIPASGNATINPVEAKVQMFVGSVVGNPDYLKLNRQLKSDGLSFFQDLVVNGDHGPLKDTTPDHPDYKPFGNGDNAKILTYLLKTDPFFASALRKTKSGYELRSFDRKDPNCNNNPSLYRRLTSALTGSGHRVNFYFDEKMEITRFKVYDDVIGKKIFDGKVNDLVDSGVDLWASSALYNTLYYSQCIHATIHVL